MHKIILGIGTNLGDRICYLQNAIKLLTSRSLITNITISSIYESEALIPNGAPDDWQKKFLNIAITGLCSLKPEDLLKEIKIIESNIGRKDRGIWSPREIDIDILAFGDVVTCSQELTIPHSEFLKRDFALIPALEIYPDWNYPVQGLFFQKKLEEIILEVDIMKNKIKKTNYKIDDIT